MNQFKQYEKELKQYSKAWNIANDFDYILNNIWCTRNFYKAKKNGTKLHCEYHNLLILIYKLKLVMFS
jgi:hypothetical protein